MVSDLTVTTDILLGGNPESPPKDGILVIHGALSRA